MANTKDMGIFDVTFRQYTDLSAKQYYLVKASSVACDVGNYVELADATDNPTPLGVIQNVPSSSAQGELVVVRMFGPTKAFTLAATSSGTPACDIDAGDYLNCGSLGYLNYSSTTGQANARALDFLDSGSAYINVFFVPFAFSTSGVAN